MATDTSSPTGAGSLDLTWHYSPQTQVERLIAGLRVILAIFSLGAVALYPHSPGESAVLSHGLLTGYALCALALGLVVWKVPNSVSRLRFPSHIIDFMIFAILVYLTPGPDNPFFVFFVFSVLSGTLRWQLRGTIWTAAAALAAFLGIAVLAGIVLHDPAVELDRFIIRSAHLAVMTAFLGYLAAYQARIERQIRELVGWPRVAPDDLDTLMREMLEHASRLIDCPRVLAVWNEAEEPWQQFVLWSAGGLQRSRERGGTYQPFVARPLAEVTFLSPDAATGRRLVLPRTATTWESSAEPPINVALASRFSIRQVVTAPLPDPALDGRIFFLDKPAMTADDLALAEVAAREIVVAINQWHLLEERRRLGLLGERARVARDLHDSVSQALTGARLQLHALSRSILDQPQDAAERVLGVERMIGTQQTDLRSFIERLKSHSPPLPARPALMERLRELRDRTAAEWGLSVSLPDGDEVPVPGDVADEVYLMVQEAIINAARHARASAARVEMTRAAGRLYVSVTDNGCGFPFRGRQDAVALAQSGQGPVNLRERVVALGGTLVLDSSVEGSRIEISIPLSAT